jgi:hypothetical protein
VLSKCPTTSNPETRPRPRHRTATVAPAATQAQRHRLTLSILRRGVDRSSRKAVRNSRRSNPAFKTFHASINASSARRIIDDLLANPSLQLQAAREFGRSPMPGELRDLATRAYDELVTQPSHPAATARRQLDGIKSAIAQVACHPDDANAVRRTARRLNARPIDPMLGL